MKASQVKLSTLITIDDHYEAIEGIERHYLNVIGGFHAWNSGRQTYLTQSAINKVKAIHARIERLFPCDDD